MERKNSLPPLFSIRGCLSLESQFVAHRKRRSYFSLCSVFALDIEFVTIDATNDTIRKVERHLGSWVLAIVIIVFEFAVANIGISIACSK